METAAIKKQIAKGYASHLDGMFGNRVNGADVEFVEFLDESFDGLTVVKSVFGFIGGSVGGLVDGGRLKSLLHRPFFVVFRIQSINLNVGM